MCIRVQWRQLVGETQRAANFGTQQVRTLPTISREKKHFSVEASRGNKERVSLWHLEARLFLGMRWFCILTEVSRERVTFCIYLYLFMLLSFYFFLILTGICPKVNGQTRVRTRLLRSRSPAR